MLTLIAVCVGGMVEIFPQFFKGERTQPIAGLTPLPALEFEGRDIYIREGCHVCHTQMVRPLRAETERYGHYAVAGEDVYEHPFLWGSKRTGPDLRARRRPLQRRLAPRTSEDPRSVVPQSNMPGYPWLFDAPLTGELTAAKLTAMRTARRAVYGRRHRWRARRSGRP